MELLSPEMFKNVGQLGFGILIFGLLVVVVRHVLTQQEKIIDMASHERQEWQKTIQAEREQTRGVMTSVTGVLESYNERAKEYQRQTREAHGYQREEHIKMIESLNVVCNTLQKYQERFDVVTIEAKVAYEASAQEHYAILQATEKIVETCYECAKERHKG